jgi:hypothetical protein
VGLVPGAGGAWYLPRVVGVAKALELFWTADFVDGAEAERIGLVNKVVPDEELLAHVQGVARKIAGSDAGSPPHQARRYRDAHQTAHQPRHDLVPLCRGDGRRSRAVDAFIEKRSRPSPAASRAAADGAIPPGRQRPHRPRLAPGGPLVPGGRQRPPGRVPLWRRRLPYGQRPAGAGPPVRLATAPRAMPPAAATMRRWPLAASPWTRRAVDQPTGLEILLDPAGEHDPAAGTRAADRPALDAGDCDRVYLNVRDRPQYGAALAPHRVPDAARRTSTGRSQFSSPRLRSGADADRSSRAPRRRSRLRPPPAATR